MAKVDVIFTRYSSDMQNPKSCTDQERDVRARAGESTCANGRPGPYRQIRKNAPGCVPRVRSRLQGAVTSVIITVVLQEAC